MTKKIIFIVFLCFISFVLGADEANPFMYHSVNVITGEYCEAQTDLTLEGPHPLVLKRFYNGFPGKGWDFNHPDVLMPQKQTAGKCDVSNKKIVYDYDDKGRVIRIKTLDAKENTTYNFFDLQYSESFCDITAHDGRKVSYQYTPTSPSLTESEYLLDNVVSSDGYSCRYQYMQHPKEHKHLLLSREEPEGRYLLNEFYEDGPDIILGKVKCQLGPAGVDAEPIGINTFSYGEGYTEVLDALNNKTVYRYSNGRCLTAIENYLKDSDGSDSLYRIERFYWKSQPESFQDLMTSRTISDANGNVEICRTFTYDSHGNIKKETFWGNLTGKSCSPIQVDEAGMPLSNDTEHYSVEFEYSTDKTSKLVRQFEDNGLQTRYAYNPQSQLLSAKFILSGNDIAIRHFYIYDQDGVLQKTILDDGSSEDPEDLHGVTERKITVIASCKDPTLFGLPDVIEERWLDPGSKEERIARLTLHHYSSYGKLLQKETYDAYGTLLESIGYSYDCMGRLVETCNDKGESTTCDFDPNGNKTYLCGCDKKGNSTQAQFLYDFSNRLIRSESCDSEGKIEVLGQKYDESGNKIAVRDSFGNETLYYYDALGRVVEIIYPEVDNGQGSWEHPIEKKEYDLFDRVSAEVDAEGRILRTHYNARGKPIEVTHPDASKEYFEYYLDGNLRQAKAKNGSTVTFERDFLGRITKAVLAAQDGTLITSSSFAYNAFHMIEKIDGNGVATRFAYNGCGKQKAINGSGGSCFEYDYDNMGNLLEKKEWFGEGPCDYSICNWEKDEEGNFRETSIKNATGSILKHIASENENSSNACHFAFNDKYYNERGQNVPQEIYTDLCGNTKVLTYDALKRLVSIVQYDSLGSALSKQEIFYDKIGNKISEIHSSLNDDRGREPYVIAWKFGVDNQIREVIEGEGSAVVQSTGYTFYASGKLKSIYKPDGVVVTYSYTPSGHIHEVASTDGTIHYQYEYDGNFNITKVLDLRSGAATKRKFDEAGRISHETLGNGLNIGFKYGRNGRKTEMRLHDQSSIKYEYDAAYLRHIHRISPDGTVLYTHSYDTFTLDGLLETSEMIGNIGYLSHQYDEIGRIKKIRSPYWCEEIPQEGYDLLHNVKELIIADCAGRDKIKYGYDVKGQIIAEEGIFNNSYAYDTLENCVKRNSNLNQIDEGNRLLETEHDKFYYDPNGNPIQKSSKRQTLYYTYDALNRLVSIKEKNKWHCDYEYDAFNRRLSKTTYQWDAAGSCWNKTETLHYLYDGKNDIGCADQKGKITELRILGLGIGAEIGSSVALEINGSAFAPIHDHRGSITCLVDINSKQVCECYRYSAFGECLIIDNNGDVISTSSVSNPWRFSGKRFDSETGLVYFGDRYYNPSVGRWMTQDPLGYVDGPNRYAFVHNNPVNNHDLYGLWSLRETWSDFTNLMGTVNAAVLKAANYLQNNYSLQEYIKKDIDDFSHQITSPVILRMLGYYSHPPEIGVYGNGELHDKVRITLITGILNIKNDIEGTLKLISETHGGVNVHYIFRPTEGWTWDIIKSGLVKFGFVSLQANQLANKWKELIQEMGGAEGGGMIVHYAHSIGAADTFVARYFLTQEEQKMVKVITFGSPTIFNDNGFHSVINYVSVRDGVAWLDPISRLIALFSDHNIVYVGSYYGWPIVDHLLDGPTYSEVLNMLGKEFWAIHAP